ncbi:MAG: glycoside hydrolase family 127 protein [Cyclobacteriaceae bacterium]|nr:glycoside hydrolase family 127 protein [Cyclobacteriaceae bacterium]
MMKYILFTFLLISLSFTPKNSREEGSSENTKLTIKGFAGSKIDQCISARIVGRDVDMLIAPFKLKDETRCWQMEFWGKWMLSAVDAWKYNHDPELLVKMKAAVDGLIATQLPNGYIGNYSPEKQLTGWDIWGRKYCLLGLLKYYEISSDKTALDAAAKSADYLIGQVGPEKTDIISTGFYRGMASTSILEPIVYLYNHTQNHRYLDFAKYIVVRWESEGGPRLISKALAGVAVKDRFPVPENWWSWENSQKAYEMMSCYDGLLELYKITKNPDYLKAVIATADNIMATEINIAGSGSAFECWYGTSEKQIQPTYHTMETCVTTTWMKLCNKLLAITGDVKYADQIEKTFYNALMASMKYDASEIAKYSPLEGARIEGENQCSMPINCCNANGPRGFVMIPEYAAKPFENGVYLNYYGPMEVKLNHEKAKEISIRVESNYPESANIRIYVSTEKPTDFQVNLRIPAWSTITKVKVIDETVSEVRPGTYCSISRTWKKGDFIDLELDMKGRVIELHNYQAIQMGPLVLARDSRFADGYVDEAGVIQQKDGFVELTPLTEKPDHVWLAFSAPLVLGTDLEGEGKNPKSIRFCDFASAGNTWDHSTRYRVWIPKTLNVMNRKYEGY